MNWSASVLPRVNFFAWKACLDALPTKLGLKRTMCSLDTRCGICGAREETAFHALFACGLAQSVWEVSQLDPCLPDGCDKIVNWWAESYKKLGEEQVSLFLTLCWAIWSERCKAAMEAEFRSASSIWAYVVKVCKEMKEMVEGRMGQREVGVIDLQVKWKVPEEAWVKINVDAGQVGELGTSLGVVCRDSKRLASRLRGCSKFCGMGDQDCRGQGSPCRR